MRWSQHTAEVCNRRDEDGEFVKPFKSFHLEVILFTTLVGNYGQNAALPGMEGQQLNAFIMGAPGRTPQHAFRGTTSTRC